jgi:hypothetical protein
MRRKGRSAHGTRTRMATARRSSVCVLSRVGVVAAELSHLNVRIKFAFRYPVRRDHPNAGSDMQNWVWSRKQKHGHWLCAGQLLRKGLFGTNEVLQRPGIRQPVGGTQNEGKRTHAWNFKYWKLTSPCS